jgi:hypothetical protein
LSCYLIFTLSLIIYIYIYMCVCVCVCVYNRAFRVDSDHYSFPHTCCSFHSYVLLSHLFLSDVYVILKILPLQSQYILSLLWFVVYNKNTFKLNSNVYNLNTRQKYNLHLSSSNFSLYQKGILA